MFLSHIDVYLSSSLPLSPFSLQHRKWRKDHCPLACLAYEPTVGCPQCLAYIRGSAIPGLCDRQKTVGPPGDSRCPPGAAGGD